MNANSKKKNTANTQNKLKTWMCVEKKSIFCLYKQTLENDPATKHSVIGEMSLLIKLSCAIVILLIQVRNSFVCISIFQ